MQYQPLSTLVTLSTEQKAALAKGKISDVAQLLLSSPEDLSRACKLAPRDVEAIIELVCKAHRHTLSTLQDFSPGQCGSFTTGDLELDKLLGGGVRTGMMWEIVGESAAGKTQIALQLSLTVQLPKEHGGLAGCTCYLPIASKLATSRMQQILENHLLLASSSCSLSSVHTIPTPTLDRLIYVLEEIFPQFLEQRPPDASPVKLLVIDALAELFHTSSKTSTGTLVERSRSISEIAHRLHTIANKYDIAVVVLNEVVDVIDRGMSHGPGELSYNEQSRWFGRADTLPGENSKEATLGLTWANQVNARIFLTRTGRRRYLEALPGQTSGGITTSSTSTEDHPVLIRRLSIVFSPISLPASCDYLVTVAGVSVVPGSIQPLKPPPNGLSSFNAAAPKQTALRPVLDLHLPQQQKLAPIDVGLMTADEDHLETLSRQADEFDEWDEYLGEWEFNDLPPSLYEGS